MARVTVEDCLNNVDSRFTLVHLAVRRVLQLRHGAPPVLENVKGNKEVVMALREIASYKINLDNIRLIDEAGLFPPRLRRRRRKRRERNSRIFWRKPLHMAPLSNTKARTGISRKSSRRRVLRKSSSNLNGECSIGKSGLLTCLEKRDMLNRSAAPCRPAS